MESPQSKPLIGIVGPCGSGKSTLLDELEKQGYPCRHIAQEHSYVQDMWEVISKPELLIYLHASFPVSTERAQLDWQEKDYDEQMHRLAHARQYADLLIETDNLSPQEVLQKALGFLTRNNS